MTMLSQVVQHEATPLRERPDSDRTALVTAMQELLLTEREYAERLRQYTAAARLAEQCDELIDMAQSQLTSMKVTARRGD